MSKRSVTEADVNGKRVLVRVDFNVPITEGEIADDTRVRAALPTINWLREHGAKLILCSHLGRPKGKVKEDLRLAPVAERLASLIDHPVTAVPVVTGPEAVAAIERMHDGDVALLENLRFDPREEANDYGFAQELASLADLYVNDAFGAAHRAHASTEGVAHHLPAYLGLLMQAEIDALSRLLDNPERPFVAIVGGAKVSDKMAVLQNLLPKVDTLLIGGGMANTFLLAQGKAIGTSLAEPDLVGTATSLMEAAARRGVTVGLPRDAVVARDITSDHGRTVNVDEIGDDEAIYDIGPETSLDYAVAVEHAKTVLWNGPLGVAENPAFAAGTSAVAHAVGRADGYTVIGGGDSVSAVEHLGIADQIDHISTGGGASLEFLEGKTLPGIAAIPEQQ